MAASSPDLDRPRGVTIRRSLFRSVFLLILFTCAAFLWITAHFRGREIEALCRAVIRQSIDLLEADLRHFFDPLGQNLLIAAQWIADGTLDPVDADAANAAFIPILRRYPQICAVSTGDGDGNNYFLRRDGDTWLNRIVRVGADGRRTEHPILNDAGQVVGEWSDPDEYDPRTRGWYRRALDGQRGDESVLSLPSIDHVFWTEPYAFFSTQRPGLTASVSVPTDTHRDLVLAVDILIDDISTFTLKLSSAAQSATGRNMVFILSDDRRVVGLPRHARLGDDRTRASAVLSPVGELGITPVSDALARLPGDHLERLDPLRYESDGEPWWAAVKPFDLAAGRTLWLGVVVPESHVLGSLKHIWGPFSAVTIAALLLVSMLAVLMARDYSEPLRQLLSQSERLRRLDLAVRPPVTSSLQEINALAESQERVRAALDSFARYVPSEIVRELLKRGQAARIGGAAHELTICFMDIRDFTAIAEGMTPTALTAHMSEYFEAMLDILLDERATVDKFIGDAILAFWGAPNPDEDHATRAVSALLRCLRRLDGLNGTWEHSGKPAFRAGIGVATGTVVVGNVGAPSRLAYTVLGDTVNLASRIEGLNRIYGTAMLVSAATMQQATGEDFAWRRVDRVAVKGKTEPVEIYEPLGLRSALPAETLESARRYENALARYQDRHFEDAVRVRSELNGQRGDDHSIRRLLNLSGQYLREPPPDEWDGTTRLAVK